MKIKRTMAWSALTVAVFAAVAALILRFMPVPRAPADYMVAGTLATLVALLLPFTALLRGGLWRR